MSKGVFTRMKRVTFVKGWLTGGTDPADGSVECGDGTPRPLEVTGATIAVKLDKIAEIFHRVKDAYFTAGDIHFSSVDVTIHSATSAPSDRSLYDAMIGYQGRGYHTLVTVGANTIPARFLPYLGDEYDDGSGGMYRDISDNEAGIHLTYQSGELPTWNNASIGVATTAFYYFATSDPLTADPLWFYSVDSSPAYYDAMGAVLVGGKIGYVLANPSDSIFTSTTRFFLTLDFTTSEGGYSLYASTLKTDDPTSVCNYVMRLSTGDLSCPMYPDAYSTAGGSASGSDFIHEATEWWPYAKAGGAVWNTGTGAKI